MKEDLCCAGFQIARGTGRTTTSLYGATPVILGRGNHYWGPMLNQQTLKLVDARTLTYERLFLHYEAVR